MHSAKFSNEKTTDEIRAAMLRYGMRHPVVNDRDFRIWRDYAVRAWPTLVLIDPEGYVIYITSGEGNEDLLTILIADTLEHFAGDLPEPAELPIFKLQTSALALAYPGKIAYDPRTGLLAVAESAGNRVLLIRDDGTVVHTAGDGEAGHRDGLLSEARFNEPQGMAFYRGALVVADRGNHMLRLIDFEKGSVSTVAGTGQKKYNPRGRGQARETDLNSPWDLAAVGDDIYIAMAGNHQIWLYHPETGTIGAFAGTGQENIRDGALHRALFAQPTGLSWDGANALYVADSETSAVRRIDLQRGRVETLVGTGLFDFGDRLGPFRRTQLQHPQDVVYKDNHVFVADSYNHRVVGLDLATHTARLVADGLHEPAGITTDGRRLFVADTNAGRIISIENSEVKEIAAHRTDAVSRSPEVSTEKCDRLITPEPSDGDIGRQN